MKPNSLIKHKPEHLTESEMQTGKIMYQRNFTCMKESGWDGVPCECCRAWICEERASQPVCASAHPEAPIPSDQINFENSEPGECSDPVWPRFRTGRYREIDRQDQNEILRRISEFDNDEEGRLLDKRVTRSGRKREETTCLKKNQVKN